MTRIPVSRSNGFLLGTADLLGHWWIHYCAVWSWAGVFHRPVVHSADSIWLEQDNIRHDACYLARTAAAVLVLCTVTWRSSSDSSQWRIIDAVFLAWCAWRVCDSAVNYVHGTLFGFKNKPGEPEVLNLPRAQRRLLLTLVDFVEVTLIYASLHWLAHLYLGASYCDPLDTPRAALQLSFSTLTTVGYGTFAPVGYRANLIALLEAFTGLLLIGGSIAQMAAMLKATDRDANDGKSQALDGPTASGVEVTPAELRMRRLLPPLLTAGSLIALWAIFYFSCVRVPPNHRLQSTAAGAMMSRRG